MTRAVVFDMYGTLLAIDAVRASAQARGARDPQGFVDTWRRKQLECTKLCSMAQAYRDFDELTGRALDYACASFGLSLDADARAKLALAWRELPAHPDAGPALQALRARNIDAAVLTNGKADSARAVLRHAGILDSFAEVLSVEAVRVYKPDPRVYALATERFDCEPAQIAFVSSNPWDAWGGAQFGFAVAWCNRSGAIAEALEPAPRAQLRSLAELDGFVASLP